MYYNIYIYLIILVGLDFSPLQLIFRGILLIELQFQFIFSIFLNALNVNILCARSKWIEYLLNYLFIFFVTILILHIVN